jgi:TolB-like protein/class 3 adenylate cyclase/cytochrome c-type biogenesis protein CcmH/NrfG
MKEEPSSAVQIETRRLAAIMFTDIVGFSRQMGSNEARTLRLLAVHNHLIEQALATHHGHVIKTFGDAFLVDFPSVVHAVQCAQHLQAQFRAHNAEQDSAEQIHIRIGIHLGDMVVQPNGDVLGDGVNIAKRLQELTEPDTICISDMVYRDVAQKIPLGTVISLGRPRLKNIAQRFPVYALLAESPKGLRQTLRLQRLKLSRRVHPARQVVVALILIAATIGAVRYFSLLTPSPQSLAPSTQAQPTLLLPDKPSIVILPFTNMSNDSEQEYFSDGLTEDLTSALSKLSGLFVISRNTASTYKGKPVKVQEVSKELGVQYVLEGSVRKAEGQVRVTAQLIDALQDHHLWTERYDRPLKDIFALQDEIVRKIVTTLKLQLTLMEQGAPGALMHKATDNLEAYDFYLRGMASLLRAGTERKKEANIQTRQLLEQALGLDPQYAMAYVGLGFTYCYDGLYQWNPDPMQSFERAIELAQRAIALDGSLSQPHLLLSRVYVWKKHYEQAIAEAQQAVALDPNDSEGYRFLGEALVRAGRPEETIDLTKKAMRLNPRFQYVYLSNLGWAYRLTGQYAEAIAPLKRSVTLNPNFLPAHFNLAICYAELDREDEARAEVTEMLRLEPDYSLERARQQMAYKDPAVVERMLAALRKAGLR